MVHQALAPAGPSRRWATLVAMGALLAISCIPAAALPTPLASRDALAADYRAWLDRARTPARVVAQVVARSPGFTVIDLVADEPKSIPTRVEPGDRLIFVHRNRTAIVVHIGERPLRDAGARLIGSHTDTPLPRASLVALDASGQAKIRAHRYGGMRVHHWLHRPLAPCWPRSACRRR